MAEPDLLVVVKRGLPAWVSTRSRVARRLAGAFLIGALALSGARAAIAQVAYAWADRPVADAYEPHGAYSHNPTGGRIEIRRQLVGNYVVDFSGLQEHGSASGTPLVTAYGDGAASCTVARHEADSAGTRVFVLCRDALNAAVDTGFLVRLHPASALGHRIARAVVRYDGGRHELVETDSHNGSLQSIELVERREGVVDVRFRGHGSRRGASHPQVTAYGTRAHCRILTWGDRPQDVTVRVGCLDHWGQPSNVGFSVVVRWPEIDGPRSVSIWASDPEAGAEILEGRLNYHPHGGPVVIRRLADGHYRLSIPQIEQDGSFGGHAQVSAYGGGDGHCKVVEWTTRVDDVHAVVRCFSASGNGRNSGFLLDFFPSALCNSNGACNAGESHRECPFECASGGSRSGDSCVLDVRQSFAALPSEATELVVAHAHVESPPFPTNLKVLDNCHVQGFQRLRTPGFVAYTANTQAGDAPFPEGMTQCESIPTERGGGALLFLSELESRRDRADRPWGSNLGGARRDRNVAVFRLNDPSQAPLFHPGGFQASGESLFIGIDGAGARSELVVVDVSNPRQPTIANRLALPGEKASTTGAVKLPDRRQLVVVGDIPGGSTDRKLFFFTERVNAAGDPRRGDLAPVGTWELEGQPASWRSTGFRFTSYQSTSLVRECGSNEIFMIGITNDAVLECRGGTAFGGSQSRVHLYRLRFARDHRGSLSSFDLDKISERRFPRLQSSACAGTGTYVSRSGDLMMYWMEHVGRPFLMHFFEFAPSVPPDAPGVPRVIDR